jgi:uncharacterized membrane protein YgcG
VKALKTIVATAVIVFALTSVAMAGVQHFTKQGGQATGAQAQAAQPSYTVTLTAAQLAQLMNGGKAATASGGRHARQTQHHAKAALQHHAKTARHHSARHRTGGATHASASGSSGTHHYETTHHTSYSSSTSGGHHAETGHHSGGGHDGGSCGG